MNVYITGLAGGVLTLAASAGSFAPAAGEEGSDAIAASDPRFVGWATGVSLQRGPVDIRIPDGAAASFGTAQEALGPANASFIAFMPVVSLGDGGSMTLTFDQPITDGVGPDFAVFENSFSDTFLELAFVEVSSDGVNFVRFPAFSETPTDLQTPTFGTSDPTNLKNLAGKYRVTFGTPFDLAELDASDDFNPQRVTHVRVVDVIGSIDERLGTRDSLGRLVNDPFPTSFNSGGFDLDAVGVLNQASDLTFEAWAEANLPEGSRDALDDPDGDGSENLLEYAAVSDPLWGTSVPLSLESSVGQIRISLQQASERTDVDVFIESSVSLVEDSWIQVGSSQGGADFSGNGITQNGSDVLLQQNVEERKFYRLRVER